MRSCSIVGFVAAFLLAWTGDISAHPLGNFSINQYSAVRIGKNEIAIRYVVDMAEIPTFQEIQESALTPLAGASSAYLRRKAESLRESLSVEVDGKKVALRTASREILFPEGAGGLPTMRIAALFKGKFDDSAAGRYELFYRDENFPGRAGWKEIIAGAENEAAVIESSVPAKDRSSQLSDYPADLLNAPPQVLEARLTFVASSALATGRSELPAIPPSPRSITSVTTDIANGAAPAGPLAALTSPQASKTA